MAVQEGDKRQAILDSAEKVFAVHGAAATIDEIAKDAGIAKGTIYLYYASKDELYISLMEDRISTYRERSRRALAGIDAPEGVIEQLVMMRTEFVSQHWGLLITLFQAGIPGSAQVHERICRAKLNAQQVFLDALENPVPRLDFDMESLLVMISGMADGLIMHRVFVSGEFDPQQTAEEVLALALPTLRTVTGCRE